MKKAVPFLAVMSLVVLLLPATAWSRPPSGRIMLRAYGGLNVLWGGEFNSGQKGWTEFYDGIFSIFGYSVEGAYRPAILGLSVGGECIYRFTPTLGIGLGAAYVRAARTSRVDYEPGLVSTDPVAYTAETELGAVPLKLSFHFFLPSGGAVSLNAHFGLGYYLAVGRARQELRDVAAGLWTADEYDVRGGGLGFHGGAGAELKLGPRISLFLEVQGRYASFANFHGELRTSDDSGWSDSVSGNLWSFTLDLGSVGAVDVFDISDTEPSGSGISNVHRTKTDFSGCSLVLGLVLRL